MPLNIAWLKKSHPIVHTMSEFYVYVIGLTKKSP